MAVPDWECLLKAAVVTGNPRDVGRVRRGRNTDIGGGVWACAYRGKEVCITQTHPKNLQWAVCNILKCCEQNIQRFICFYKHIRRQRWNKKIVFLQDAASMLTDEVQDHCDPAKKTTHQPLIPITRRCVLAVMLVATLEATHSHSPWSSLLRDLNCKLPLDRTLCFPLLGFPTFTNKITGLRWQWHQTNSSSDFSLNSHLWISTSISACYSDYFEMVLEVYIACLTFLHVMLGNGSPSASQGMTSSRPASCLYSPPGTTINLGGSYPMLCIHTMCVLKICHCVIVVLSCVKL